MNQIGYIGIHKNGNLWLICIKYRFELNTLNTD